MLSGSLLINKEVGFTSRQEVNNISRILKEKKAGHIGTLDPFADGLLIVLIGSSTKIAPFLEVMDKTYIATLKLGEATDTGDLTGNVIEKREVVNLTTEKINDTLSTFLGKQLQTPPMYSALKVNGKQLYKYAREGKEIERKQREIEVFNIKLLSFKDNEITFEAKVSKGTYIRTLGEDIAKRLGTVGYLTKLTRTQVGPYKLEDSIRGNNVKESDLISMSKMLEFMPSYEVEGELAKKALNGMHFRLPITNEKILLKDKNGIIAIYERLDTGVYSPVRGLR